MPGIRSILAITCGSGSAIQFWKTSGLKNARLPRYWLSTVTPLELAPCIPVGRNPASSIVLQSFALSVAQYRVMSSSPANTLEARIVTARLCGQFGSSISWVPAVHEMVLSSTASP